MRTPSFAPRTRARLGAGGLALVLVVVVAVVGVLWWRDDATRLEQALETAPPGTQRFGFVDWAGVRRELGAGGKGLEALLEQAFDSDLSAPSALRESAEGLAELFGLSPLTLEWEAFSQGEKGASLALKVPEDFDFQQLAEDLKEVGFTPPDQDVFSGGVWDGGPEVLARTGETLTPELQYWALLEDQRLVITSDRAEWVPRAVAAARGGEQVRESMRHAADASGDTLATILLRGDYTCEYLSMHEAGPSAQDRARALIEAAGGIDPVTAYAISLLGDRHGRLVLTFETAEEARANADSRARLASGPAPGQGGSFTDRFRLVSTVAEGTVVTMSVRVRPHAWLISDFSHGPVLFATC